ncbi:TlpA disulfide reductase family protein [Cypionkella sp.]|uniref:TlpA disulfide reductase family protein n=1 Tax=Cypionkella sp. TaxID=2811411 RepID=UPI002721BB0F|nr:TlpA disulfide reductase family protein [Cypionkella sp.]MDO8986443.1 TlpA disulfide reductase family protein [Cypionkella sp.]MDP2048216.1 TlpA disulfide reductase family protein [Cypionkella sp.]
MKRRDILLSTLALALMAKPAFARPPFTLGDDPVPLLSPPFEDGAGRDLMLSDFAGRVVMLNIWATWCPPCREEMPALDALQRKLGGPDFAVVPISTDRGGIEAVRNFYDDIGIRDLGLYWGEDVRVQLAFAAFGLPTTLLIDRKGQELARVSGPAKWDKPAAIKQIKAVIDAGT